MTSKNLINADTVNTGSVNYKNRIINGDFQINQKQKPVISNGSDYAVDRVFVDAINSEVIVTDEIVYSLNEGSIVTNTDPLGDSSQVAMYRFEDAASGGKVTCDNDSNYNGQWQTLDSNGNPVDTDGYYKVGKFDNAASFDGSHFIKANITNNVDITVSLFAYITNTTDTQFIFTQANDSNNNYSRGISVSNNYLLFYSRDSSGNWKNVQYYNNIPSNKFIHLVFIQKGNIIKAYIDGKYISEFDMGSTASFSDYFNFGKATYDKYYFENGLIDQVRIFNRELTEDEVRKLYVEDLNYINKKHLKVEVTSKDSNANINPYVYKFEGQDIKDIVNNDMTLSFEMLSSVTGDYTVKLVTETLTGEQETFTKTITYDSSYNGDFGSFSITIPKGTFTKSLIDDERLGATLYIMNNADSNLNVGDVVRLTNVQLEVGSVATEFEVLPYDRQLERCMRYYERFNNVTLGVSYECNSCVFQGNYNLKFYTKRTIPTMLYNISVSNVATDISISSITNNTIRFYVNDTSNSNSYCYINNISLDSEL